MVMASNQEVGKPPSAEGLLVNRLQVCGDWVYTVDSITLWLLVKDFLDRRVRAAVSPKVINSYFDELEKELAGIPPSNIIYYDESNLTDEPGRCKVIIRLGSKYPEWIINSSKSATSVMFSVAGNGIILTPCVVYRAQHLYRSWTEGGPTDSRYNRTMSGWFHCYCFNDWFQTISIPYLRRLEGKNLLIGDNLSSHLYLDSIRLCEENNLSFIFLPNNSTHLTQPLDVEFLKPTKMKWREIILEWKKGPGRNESTIPKETFPGLLKKLFHYLKEENVVAGFKKYGIGPLSRNKVLQIHPIITNTDLNISSNEHEETANTIEASLLELLKALRQNENPQKKTKRKKLLSLQDTNVNNLTLPSTSNQDGVRKPQKKSERIVASSSSEYSEDEQESEVANVKPSDTDLSWADYAVVKVYGKAKQSFRLYVCKVYDSQDNGYVGVF
ncbi:hypothetical protein PR048_004616 [Dryococelus australis]|uniref:DDE-1 domain-containing protein n=1 Tax=Dryococelus australis TaxID=614101 RepID=A0ABQ9I5Y3_9NEOP|nr:hypothetical protein PR048_004616 [Dryococelus australis]